MMTTLKFLICQKEYLDLYFTMSGRGPEWELGSRHLDDFDRTCLDIWNDKQDKLNYWRRKEVYEKYEQFLNANIKRLNGDMDST